MTAARLVPVQDGRIPRPWIAHARQNPQLRMPRQRGRVARPDPRAEPAAAGVRRVRTAVDSRSSPVRIGCAGWSIPSRHKHLFGEGGSHLARYATRFDVTEINSTFYRPHQPRTFERWAASVPARFRFSVKLPRQITHEARLLRTGDALTEFFDGVAGLGKKLGGVLVQLPPSLAFDARV